MEKVLNQAEMLAEAILESQEYISMRLAEQAAMRDENATQLIAAYSEKRQAVEALLAQNEVDHEALAVAGREMEEAEHAVNEVALVKELQEARQMFSLMMDNVNHILKVIITGEDEEEHGCSGDCGCCSGCNH